MTASRTPWWLDVRIDGRLARPRYETAEMARSGAADLFESIPKLGAILLHHDDGRPVETIRRTNDANGVEYLAVAITTPMSPKQQQLSIPQAVIDPDDAAGRPSSRPEKCPIHDVPLPVDKTCEACVALEPLSAKGYLR